MWKLRQSPFNHYLIPSKRIYAVVPKRQQDWPMPEHFPYSSFSCETTPSRLGVLLAGGGAQSQLVRMRIDSTKCDFELCTFDHPLEAAGTIESRRQKGTNDVKNQRRFQVLC
jgi:hypothetical protein